MFLRAKFRPVINKVSSLYFFSLFFFSFLFVEQTNNVSGPPTSLVNDVFTHTNEYRKAKGLKPLKLHDKLNKLAKEHSEDMAAGKEQFGHTGFSKRSKQISKIFQSCTTAENVAYGPTTGKEVVDMWKNSAGHRKNMLGNYEYIGIGIAKNKNGRIYYTQIFVR